jgi:thiol-disulfide isomerase/thioredoxin
MKCTLLSIYFTLAAAIQTLTHDTYNDFINANRVVLVKYTTPWCFYCTTVNSLYTKLENALITENIGCALGTVDGDENEELVKEQGVKYYPDVRLIVNGVVHKFTWEYTSDKLIEFIKHGIDTNPIKDLSRFTTDTSSSLKVLWSVIGIGCFCGSFGII